MRISDWSSDVCSSDLAAEVAGAPDKADTAFRTIGELSRETGLPQHILRYWETRFPQLRPLQRAGQRRYYRPRAVDLVRRLDPLPHREGYTLKGVQPLPATHDAAPPARMTSPDAQLRQFPAH